MGAAADSEPAARVGVVTVSDRASRGEYEDRGGPAISDWLKRVMRTPWEPVPRVVPDERAEIAGVLRSLADDAGCCLIITTGGTGPAPRDVTPEATADVCDRMMPGFGECMRAVSLQVVPTAILSRQTAGIRGQSLIVNLPGQPKAIGECLEAVFPAIPYCVELIGGPWIDSDPDVLAAFRPKSARRPDPDG
ncbi:MAG: molybdopterin adenylyltransferase [Phycisphaerales bacterium]